MQPSLIKKINVRTLLGCVALGAVALWLTTSENTDSEASIKLLGTKSKSVEYGENNGYQNLITPKKSTELRDVAQPTISVNALDDIYVKLFDANPDERLKTLDIILQSTASYFSSTKIVSRLEEMVADDDARVAEIAQIVLVNIEGLRSAGDMENGLLVQNDSTLNPDPEILEPAPRLDGMTDKEVEKLTPKTPPDYARKISDPDASVRGDAITEALTQRDEYAANVLYQAMRDVDANNRLLALDGLHQMLSAGLGDTQYIMAIFGKALSDPDPQVALLAEQAMRGF